MLRAIKTNAGGPDKSNPHKVPGETAGNVTPVHASQTPHDGNLNHLINQTSETTIYTNAVPSASLSQECPRGFYLMLVNSP